MFITRADCMLIVAVCAFVLASLACGDSANDRGASLSDLNGSVAVPDTTGASEAANGGDSGGTATSAATEEFLETGDTETTGMGNGDNPTPSAINFTRFEIDNQSGRDYWFQITGAPTDRSRLWSGLAVDEPRSVGSDWFICGQSWCDRVGFSADDPYFCPESTGFDDPVVPLLCRIPAGRVTPILRTVLSADFRWVDRDPYTPDDCREPLAGVETVPAGSTFGVNVFEVAGAPNKLGTATNQWWGIEDCVVLSVPWTDVPLGAARRLSATTDQLRPEAITFVIPAR